MRIAIATLGCKVNQSESASIEGILREKGYEIVPYTDPAIGGADVYVINTCTVTAKSDYQSRQLIRRAIKSGAKVIATGCYAQLRHEELSGIEGLTLIIGNSQKENLHEYLKSVTFALSKTSRCWNVNSDRPSIVVDSPETPLTLNPYSSDRSRAFLKVQDGCNFSCSYCSIPLARGRSRSLNLKDTLEAIDRLSNAGYREIVLTGIHLGSYGLAHYGELVEPRSSLTELVDKASSRNPSIRFRLSSIEPQEINTGLLSLIKQGRLCPHLHIPLQSGSDRILKAMNRGYSKSFFKNLIQDVSLNCPGIAIGTDVIAGFPGETEEDFQKTVMLLEDLPLSYIHVFPYSKRPNTKASQMPNQLTENIKRKRAGIIREVSKKKKYHYITRHLGQIMDVIIEGNISNNGLYKGISQNYLKVLLKGMGLSPGRLFKAKALEVRGEELFCEVVRKPV